ARRSPGAALALDAMAASARGRLGRAGRVLRLDVSTDAARELATTARGHAGLLERLRGAVRPSSRLSGGAHAEGAARPGRVALCSPRDGLPSAGLARRAAVGSLRVVSARTGAPALTLASPLWQGPDVPPTRHALNREFAWEAHDGPFRRITPAQAAAYDEAGFFVLEDAFDPATVGGMIAEIDPIEARVTAVLRGLPGGRAFIADADALTFSVHLVKHSSLLRAFCCGPVFQDLAHDLVGPNVRLYWDQAVYKKPEKPQRFPWHQDNGYAYVEP